VDGLIDYRNCLLAQRAEARQPIAYAKTVSKTDSSKPGPRFVGLRKAASTICLALAFPVIVFLFGISPSRQDAKNATAALGFD
jgi:hypothetical protein